MLAGRCSKKSSPPIRANAADPTLYILYIKSERDQQRTTYYAVNTLPSSNSVFPLRRSRFGE